MPVIQPNLDDVKEFTPLEPGNYHAKVIEVEYKSSKKDNPMIVPKFEIQVPGEEAKTKMAFLVITGAGAFNFEQFLRACHFDDYADALKDPSINPKPQFDTDQLIGQELTVQIEAGTYNGRLTDNIVGYTRA